MRTSSSAHQRCYKGAPESGAWLSLQYLDRTEVGRKRSQQAEAMDDKEKRKKDKNSSSSDRVTLKKEIGLLSACAIIIGECVKAFLFYFINLSCLFMKSASDARELERGNAWLAGQLL